MNRIQAAFGRQEHVATVNALHESPGLRAAIGYLRGIIVPVELIVLVVIGALLRRQIPTKT